jgi:hypothetical protein
MNVRSAEEKEEKDRLKTKLHDVIVRVLRKRSKLAYFQVCLSRIRGP